MTLLLTVQRQATDYRAKLYWEKSEKELETEACSRRKRV
jgi:hypothetical protein